MSNSTVPFNPEEPNYEDPIVILGIVLIVIAVLVTLIFIFGALANCCRKSKKNKNNSSGLEIKSSAKRHGPGAFVKDADFSYINIESRSTDKKKKRRELERYRSLERYNSIKVDNVNIARPNAGTQTGSSISRDQDDEGPVIISDSSSSNDSRDNTKGYTPPKRLINRLYEPKTSNVEQSSPKSDDSSVNQDGGQVIETQVVITKEQENNGKEDESVANHQQTRLEDTVNENENSMNSETDSHLPAESNIRSQENSPSNSSRTVSPDNSRENQNKSVLTTDTPVRPSQGQFKASILSPSYNNNLRLQLLERERHNLASPTNPHNSPPQRTQIQPQNNNRTQRTHMMPHQHVNRARTSSYSSQPEIGGARTVIYVLGDDYDLRRNERVDLRQTSFSTENINKRPRFIGDGLLQGGYIDSLDNARFEDPRLYSSYL